jgi:thioredoxin 1
MKFLLIQTFSLLLILTSACTTGQNPPAGFVLTVEKFQAGLKAQPEAVLLDVRTPEEFAGGYLSGARNIDWNAGNFEEKVAGLEKTKPTYVYCLAGARSANAAKAMRKMGFTNVYELEGGILKWRAAGLPEAHGAKGTKAKGMGKAEFEAKLKTTKTVFVDFYADWCGPCKKMKPDMDKIAEEQKETLSFLRIDADANPELATELGVTALPTLIVFRNQKETARSEGFQTKAQMLDLIGRGQPQTK